MWNLRGLAPESSRPFPILAAVVFASGVAACGPSNGGGTSATYNVVFTLSNTARSLTDLDFTVTYTGGNFSGTGQAVNCSPVDAANELDASDDNVDTLTVKIDAAVDLDDDANLVECDFIATAQPTQDNFTIVIDASEPEDPEDVDVVVTSTELVGESLVAE